MRRTLCVGLVVAVMLTSFAFGAGSGEAEPAPAGGPVELVVWSHWGNEVGKRDWIDEMTAGFESENPNVDIRVEWYGDKGDLYTQLNAANQGGGQNAPDIHTVDFRPYGAIPQEQNGWLLDLTDGLDPTHWDADLLGSASYGGGIWGIPIESFGIWVWYDKALFAEWGIRAPADGRMTWQMFEEIRRKAAENDMVVFGQGVQNLPIFASHYPVAYLLNRAGVDVVRQAFITAERPYNDPAVVAGLQEAVDLIPELFNPDVATLSLFQGAGLFFNRKAALTIEGSFLTSWLDAAQKDGAAPADLDLGILRFPLVPNGKGNGVMEWGAGSGWAASAFTKHPETVIDFFNFISTPKNGTRWIELSNVTTGIKADPPATASELIRTQLRWQQDGPVMSPAVYQVPAGDEVVQLQNGMVRFFVDPNYTAAEFLAEMQRLRERNR